MALALGQKAPNFTLASTSGTDFSLNETLKGKMCVLFFYPKDFTKVCTAEVCHFRDQFAVFRDLGIDVVGISRDSVATHHRFKKQFKLPFELLADEDGKVSKAYKAKIPIIDMSRRITYLLDAQHKIAAVYENMFNAEQHIKSMIESLKSKELN